MSRVRVKICGVRNLEEAMAAVEAGADALGFNFWPKSPRYVSPTDARSVIKQVSPLIASIGVFVNEPSQRIIEIANATGLSAVQLHGDETPEFCAAFASIKLIKAFRVGSDFDCASIKEFPVEMVLLDTGAKGSYGGTGKVFDWRVAVEAKKYAPVMLAGGLKIENVAEAISTVTPAAIDVCSGIEAAPGRKDLAKLRDFMAEVARANAMIGIGNERRQGEIYF
jgi:phosphoribosylanthranilate isomerase